LFNRRLPSVTETLTGSTFKESEIPDASTPSHERAPCFNETNFTVTATDSSTGTGPFTGSRAYSLVVSAGRTLYAVVDSRGFRPLVLGRLGTGMVIASETCALDLVGASMACELQPGEFVRIDDGRVTELPRLAHRPVSRCVFELVYFARPDSTVFGESVDRVRRELGRQLAREQPAQGGEVVFSVPDSSNAMALGAALVVAILVYGLTRRS